MRAMRLANTVGSAVLRAEKLAEPQPGKGEVLIRVHAAGRRACSSAREDHEAVCWDNDVR